MLHTVLSVFLVFFIVYGIDGFGVSPPRQVVRVNETFTISCYVDEFGGELNFYDNDKLVPNGTVKRINDTFVELTRFYERPVKKNFTCKQKRNVVNLAEVVVEDQMPPVRNFKCRTKDLVTMLCSFKKPAVSQPIKYSATFTAYDGMIFNQELKQDGRSGYTSEIKVPETSQSLSELKLGFVVQANSKFYELQENFDMKLLSTLTPREIEVVNVMESITTHNTALITFTLPGELAKVSQDLMFDVRLKLADDDLEEWKEIEHPRLQVPGVNGVLAIDNLRYANTAYKVKLRFKAKAASDIDEMWSPYKEVAFITRPRVPEMAPPSCANCFNVMDNGNIVVYWMEVPKRYQNADGFAYRVRGWDERGNQIINRDFNTTAMELLSDLNAETVTINISSVNSEGSSENSSELVIPLKRLQSKRKLLKIHKEIVKDSSKYEISWKPLTELDVESFTIVWCHQRNELPNQCDGPVNFLHLPSNETRVAMETMLSNQFGVAVNQRNKSIVQGFEWAECMASAMEDIGRVHSLWSSAVGDSSITVQWTLNCVDEPIVIGYNFTHCAVNDDDPNQCDGPSVTQEELTFDRELHQYEFKNLKSYKLYKISVELMSRKRLGAPKTISIRTLEGAPTAPRNLKAAKIERDSIDLTWNRSREVNGQSMTYQLWYNDHKLNIDGNATMNETFTLSLLHLEAFTNYTITVVACTRDCSPSSESLTLRTAMGEPGAMFQPKLESRDENKILISWESPEVVGGSLDYFQLQLIAVMDYESVEPKLYRIDGRARSCIIEGFKCEAERVEFSIRGVNSIVPSGRKLANKSVNCFQVREAHGEKQIGEFYGEWSQRNSTKCRKPLPIVLMLATLISLLFLIVSIFFFIRCYNKYKDMKDIHIIWPKGLDPDAPSSPVRQDTFDGVKDLDLVKDHVLTDIEEEEEVMERVKFIPTDVQTEAQPIAESRESSKSEIVLPFSCNPKTNEIFYHMPKMGKEKGKSLPSSPERLTPGYAPFSTDPNVDLTTGYMKMFSPQKSLTDSTKSSMDGYLDMSGKSPSAVKKKEASDYLSNEVKMFIKDSEMNNNGYIGKRASIVSDPNRKHPPVITTNGYVGLQHK